MRDCSVVDEYTEMKACAITAVRATQPAHVFPQTRAGATSGAVRLLVAALEIATRRQAMLGNELLLNIDQLF